MMPKYNNKGFTLLELLIAVAVASIMGGLIATSMSQQQKSHTNQLEAGAVQQNLRVGMIMAAREIRLAGYQPYITTLAGAAITNAQVDSLTFTYVADNDGVNNNADSTVDEENELETITFSLYDAYSDGDTDLGRDDGVVAPISENIDGLEFFYTLADGAQTIAPTADQLDDIRSIQMTILARSENPLRQPVQNETFTTPSGATWGPFNDKFRRLILTTNIICRNMG
jgi:type IV pilus assembly protein PilW